MDRTRTLIPGLPAAGDRPRPAHTHARTGGRKSSGVGVLDKTSLILDVVEAGPASLSTLVAATGLARPTVHRLALALERLDLLSRDLHGRFVPGLRLRNPTGESPQDPLITTAVPVLTWLREATGTSARLYRRSGAVRVCMMSADISDGTERTDAVGTAYPMKVGAASQILLAWETPDQLYQGLHGAQFNATTLAGVRRQGWAQSVGGGRLPIASVAAPVRDPRNRVVAAIALSGPVELLSRHPGRSHGRTVIGAADRIECGLAR